jgi:hypothetical protein
MLKELHIFPTGYICCRLYAFLAILRTNNITALWLFVADASAFIVKSHLNCYTVYSIIYVNFAFQILK